MPNPTELNALSFCSVAAEVELAYRQYGDPQAPTVLLCHGLGSNSLQWNADAYVLAERGFRVIVPDLRGHGASTRPQNPRRSDFTVWRIAEDIAELCQQLEIVQIDFVGNALGGLLAFELIEHHPGLLRSLTTFGTAYSLHCSPLIPWMRRLTQLLISRDKLPDFTAEQSTKIDAAKTLLRKIFSQFDAQTNHLINLAIYRYDYLAIAAAFDGPILLLRGSDDTAINTELDDTIKALANKANFSIVEMANAGHYTNLDQPEAFRGALTEFLDSLRTRLAQ